MDNDMDDDDFECFAELIDGSWTFCGCPECDERVLAEEDLFGPEF
jgi:hypothetical protein